ncbi:NAD(P)/FAD-dependent oxidoreductase [Thalassotalea piscium]
MKSEQFDVVIIGAGPSGAAAGAMLSDLGWRVLILEKQHFPRFSIGESLLPQCMAFLKAAGLEQKVHDSADILGFQFKNGAAFQKNDKYTEFDFTRKFSSGPSTTYQVKRASFDKVLADGAQDKGADIRYGHQVKTVNVDGEKPILTVLDESDQSYQIVGRYLLDASGFARVLPRLLNLETPSNFPVRSAFFAHFNDKIDDADFDRNKILITVHPVYKDIWFWTIPFSDGTSSIGVVGKPEQLSKGGLSQEQLLLDFISQAPNLKALLKNATLINEVQSITGYSANVTSLIGNNYALLGNAGEFLDPVFSSGVTIALCSAVLISPEIDKFLKGEAVDFNQSFVKPLSEGVKCFKTFVTSWYEGGFQDVIFCDQQTDKIERMLSSILAGYAWDKENPYVAQSERRFSALVDVCRS